MSIVKSPLDDMEGKNELRRDIPILRGLNSPRVKLDTDMSVEESPDIDRKDEVESLRAR